MVIHVAAIEMAIALPLFILIMALMFTFLRLIVDRYFSEFYYNVYQKSSRYLKISLGIS